MQVLLYFCLFLTFFPQFSIINKYQTILIIYFTILMEVLILYQKIWKNITVDQKQSYIPKANQHLAEQLAVKKYLLLTLRHLNAQKAALEFYL